MNAVIEFVERARRNIGVKEVPRFSNRGPSVDIYQTAVDKLLGKEAAKPVADPWCMAFVMCMGYKTARKTGEKFLLAPSKLCRAVWNNTSKSCRRALPAKGRVVIFAEVGGGTSGHTGIVDEVSSDGTWFWSIEGNTTDTPNVQRLGDGVYRVKRSVQGTHSMKILGYLTAFSEAPAIRATVKNPDFLALHKRRGKQNKKS